MPKSSKNKSHSFHSSNPYATTKEDRQALKASKNANNSIPALTSGKGIQFTKTHGQHILKNPGMAKGIVDKASDLKPSDIILEVGPGTGNLTTHILERNVKKIIAIDVDSRMMAELTKRFVNNPKLELLLGDVISYSLPKIDVCISNTPYQISSPLIFKLLTIKSLRYAVLMLQKEFADRLVAKPGDSNYCRLSVNVGMWAKSEMVMKVNRGNFRPPPKVDSCVVKITPFHPRPDISFDEFDGLLRICFNRKNKSLKSIFLGTKSVLDQLLKNYKLVKSFGGGKMVVEGEEDASTQLDEHMDEDIDIKAIISKVFTDAGLEDARAAKCEKADFLRLLLTFNQAGIHFS